MSRKSIPVQTLRESVDRLSTAVQSLLTALARLDRRLRRLKDDPSKEG